MLNNPNEWHNEDDDMSRDLLGDDYFDDLGDDSEDFSEDGEYEEQLGGLRLVSRRNLCDVRE